MVDFGELRDKAEDLAGEHAEQLESGAEKAGDLAKDRFGHDDQIDQGVEKIKDIIPGGE